MKIIAFYLPQFHNIPENDEWWGDGFTEWTNVKGAKPIYRGQQQPKVPLNKNYYNLLDDNVKIWQARLAKNMVYMVFAIIITGLMEKCYYKNQWNKCLKIHVLIFHFAYVGLTNHGLRLGLRKIGRY